jgi:hypothetical protein
MTEKISPEFERKFIEGIEKSIKKMKENNACITYTWNIDGGWLASTTVTGNDAGTIWSWYGKAGEEFVKKEDFIPVKIIYNCPATICYFKDGTKTIVKCAEDEEFIKEEGVMACIMKKIFASRNKFKKLVDAGYESTDSIFERNAHNATLHRKQR